MSDAKIVCTLGPASADEGTIRDLADAGMSVARLNASHGTTADRADVIDRVRTVDQERDDPLAVMLDLRGPEIRTAPLDAPIELVEGSTVTFVEGETATSEQVGLSTGIGDAAVGDRVLLDDGRIETTITAIDGDAVEARVENGGNLDGRSGVNLPGVDLGLDVVTEHDRRDLELAADAMVDFVAASFIRDADDVHAVRSVLADEGAEIPIIAKIERADAVDAIDDIIDASYGVMVARGDLGVECPMEEVPVIQKRLIRRAHEAGTPVITATEMLDSMITQRRPTRAEASDVANAVLDGTDAVMLSGETAIGDHPVRVVEAMERIVEEVEASPEYAELREQRIPTAADTRTDALARSARFLARDIGASAVVVASESGYTALKTAKYRPGVPVVVTTPNDRVRRQLALSWGVRSCYAPMADSANTVIENAVDAALDVGAADSGDTVVAISGMMTELEGPGTTNMLKVHVAAETVATGRVVVAGRAIGPLHRLGDGGVKALPEGAVLLLEDRQATLDGDVGHLAGIVSTLADPAATPTDAARAHDLPLLCNATFERVPDDGTRVTLDGDRGVVYAGEITTRRDSDREGYVSREQASVYDRH
jgi:pyruvate kinase